MSTAATLRPTRTVPATAAPGMPSQGRLLRSVVTAVSDVVAELPLDDPRWVSVGPRLTAFVEAARLAAGMPGSPIGPDEAVATVLRVRDLARLAQSTAADVAFATPEAEAGLRSLRAAALR